MMLKALQRYARHIRLCLGETNTCRAVPFLNEYFNTSWNIYLDAPDPVLEFSKLDNNALARREPTPDEIAETQQYIVKLIPEGVIMVPPKDRPRMQGGGYSGNPKKYSGKISEYCGDRLGKFGCAGT